MVSIESFTRMALSFPGVVEQPHFEKTSFRTNNKIFATLDVSKRLACIKLSEVDQFAFSSLETIYPIPNKWGKQGWTFINLLKIDESLCQDALSTSFGEVNKKKSQKKN